MSEAVVNILLVDDDAPRERGEEQQDSQDPLHDGSRVHDQRDDTGGGLMSVGR